MQLVFFDLETSGLDSDAEVLQIAGKSDSSVFNEYIMPRNPIPPEASRINKLTVRDGDLYHNDEKKLPTVERRAALLGLLRYLRQFGKPCVLIAHNCPFDCRFLMRLIIDENLEADFAQVIAGFTDTLEMFGRKFPERRYKRGQLTLKTLAAGLALPTAHAHDAQYDVYLLQEVAYRHFSRTELVENRKSFTKMLRASM